MLSQFPDLYNGIIIFTLGLAERLLTEIIYGGGGNLVLSWVYFYAPIMQGRGKEVGEEISMVRERDMPANRGAPVNNLVPAFCDFSFL